MTSVGHAGVKFRMMTESMEKIGFMESITWSVGCRWLN
jgi:hypothetical protein